MEISDDAVQPVSSSAALLAQTPQMFLSNDIKAAYQQAYDPRFTDPASVAAGIKIPLTPVEGERYNIRIDTPEDLSVAGALRQLSIAAKNN